jgi:mRNA-degrading endonuclease RelE of RelBE toxin-antitoxin system
MSFHVEVDPAALADYRRLDPADRRVVREVLGALVLDGVPVDAEIIAGEKDAYRVNIGEDLVMLVLGFESEVFVSAIIPRIWQL